MHDCSCLMERIVSHRLDCGVHRDTAEHMLTLSANAIRVQVLICKWGKIFYSTVDGKSRILAC